MRQLAISIRFSAPLPERGRESAVESENKRQPRTLMLPFTAPYDWKSILAFFSTRSIPGVEVVEGESYYRTIEIHGRRGTLQVSFDRGTANLVCSIDAPSAIDLDVVRKKLVNMFDLATDISKVEDDLSKDRYLVRLIQTRPGLRVPGGWNPFEVAVRAVLGQQISVVAARRLAGILCAKHGKPLGGSGHPLGLTHLFPTAKALVGAAELGLGMPRARLETIKSLAITAAENPKLFEPGVSLQASLEKLLGLRGIGEWTANYIAMRAMREMDAFPVKDIGILRGAEAVTGTRPSPNDLLLQAEAWRPWRAYAAQHLWAADSARDT